MKTDDAPLSTHDYLKKVSQFLSGYAIALLACGATTIRIQKNVERIAKTYNTSTDITVTPLHIMLTVWDKNHNHSYTNNIRMRGGRLNFALNTELSKLSWDIADNGINLHEAEKKFDAIVSQPTLNHWMVLLLVGLANASFCRLFGGDPIAMLIVFVATVNGFHINRKLQQWHCDARIAVVAAAFLSAVVASSGFVFDWGDTPDVALGTSVLYLVPGVPFINSFSDFLHGHYICSMSRFLQALTITICLSLGLYLAMMVMNIKLI